MSLRSSLRSAFRAASNGSGSNGTRAISSTPRWRAVDTPSSTTDKREVASKKGETKDSLNPVYDEYSRSGSDQAAGNAIAETAYTRGNNDPDAQNQQAREESRKAGSDSNPLEFSPANTDFGHKMAGGNEVKMSEGADTGVPKQSSGSGSGQKGGRGQRYRDPENLSEETKRQKRDADRAI